METQGGVTQRVRQCPVIDGAEPFGAHVGCVPAKAFAVQNSAFCALRLLTGITGCMSVRLSLPADGRSDRQCMMSGRPLVSDTWDIAARRPSPAKAIPSRARSSMGLPAPR